MRCTALLALLASPAAADPALVDFMGGQGCTIGPDSRAAAIAAGFDEGAIDALVGIALAEGRASKQGLYIVLDRKTCTIHLPDLASPLKVSSPEILAITSPIDAYAADGWPGCFLQDPIPAFDRMNGGVEGAGFHDYLRFIAAGLISGDLRYYGTSPLEVLPGFQVVTGACADVPEIAAIRRNHVYVVKGFGEFIRQVGERTPCGEEPALGTSLWPSLGATLQGGDYYAPPESPAQDYNAWLYMEYKMISFAAGWREGMDYNEKGEPRPPLCHYP